jgi:hypothetical protein
VKDGTTESQWRNTIQFVRKIMVNTPTSASEVIAVLERGRTIKVEA